MNITEIATLTGEIGALLGQWKLLEKQLVAGWEGMTDINKIYIILNKKEVYCYVNV